jgi:hypothetical protein
MLFAPSAVARLPLAFAFVPTAVAFAPLARSFTPQPKDDADADAPLLLAVTELTTGMVFGVAFVRMSANAGVTSVTTTLVAVGAVTLTPVTALVNVGAVVPGVKVKKLFAVGAVTPVTNVPGVVVTPVTTGVVIGVPFRNGTVSKGPTVPGLLTLVNTIVPELLVVVVPLGLKANRAAGGALFGIDWLRREIRIVRSGGNASDIRSGRRHTGYSVSRGAQSHSHLLLRFRGSD